MTGFGAADTDVLITFEDILAGKCGELEASLAQQQAARLVQDSEQSADTVGRVQVDDSGYDMRVGMQPVVDLTQAAPYSSAYTI